MSNRKEEKFNTKEKISEYTFMKYPRALNDSPDFSHISIEARTLLAMIFDRYELSKINPDRFTDEKGNVYVVYTLEQVCKKLNCSNARTLRIFKELEENGMIIRKRKNRSKPYRIYLTCKFFELIKCEPATSQNSNSRANDLKIRDFTKCEDSNNNKSNNKQNNNNPSIIGFARTEDEIREQIEYECLVCDENKNLLDEIVMIISDVLNGTSPTVRIGKDDMPRGVVISRFCRLNGDHICYVMSELKTNTSKIKNIKQYLITLLYNAPATMEIEVTALYSYYHSD